MSLTLDIPETREEAMRGLAPALPSLAGLTRGEMLSVLADLGVPERQLNMRVGQLWKWVYGRGARDFHEMTDTGKALRQALAERWSLDRPEIVAAQTSADGTRKWLLRVAPASAAEPPGEVECVYIPEADRGTLCISSQIGCTLNCRFCHTGTQRLVRNLTAAEIVGQILIARDALGEWPGAQRPADGPLPEADRAITNIVLMGMGEPLYNFDNVRDAMKIAMDPEGIQLSRRRITLSTRGVVPEIARTAEEIGCLLAISFHATPDETRDVLVPINNRWNIEELL
ncbi:MAG TPA: 23S rRNA (adenine(2503)-C(2))-methyltransferase RlmN, partial [Hyphomicrobiales bacterium]|nr:23S rRNA (adenine(2503)-C(2))-methyltransferase RlmN [Hyphomicrobiales bacterium]